VAERPYEVEFYQDDEGKEPALVFMRSLEPFKKRAIGVAINEVLQYEGKDVADGNMGRNLGDGLYEFRLDQNAEQILRRKGKDPKPESDEGKILLRLFFHPMETSSSCSCAGTTKASNRVRPTSRKRSRRLESFSNT
jgi:hypothetical protein